MYEYTQDPMEALKKLTRLRQVIVEVPKRSSLSQVVSDVTGKSLTVAVVRNFAAEVVNRWTEKLLNLTGVNANFLYTDYDDSLSALPNGEFDVILVMIDFRRYSGSQYEVAEWFSEQLERLRLGSRAPIIVLGPDVAGESRQHMLKHLHYRVDVLPGVYLVDPGPTIDWDSTKAEVSQSPYNGTRAIEISRHIALKWIPAALGETVRLLILDLDNTLYNGVLGEDGTDGLQITTAHRELLHKIKDLSNNGVLLAIASRNLEEDVEALFESGALEPLSKTDFFAIEADWGKKSEQVDRILEAANFSARHALYLDDNGGELLEVIEKFPDLSVFHADSAESSLAALAWFPGVWKFEISETDVIRSDDLKANKQRRVLVDQDPIDRIENLKVSIELVLNPRSQLSRLAELSRKTNQFNTNLARLTETEILRRLMNEVPKVICFSLEDRFSNSGVVGSIVAMRHGDEIVVDEIVVSCRALGRGLEGLILDEGLGALAKANGVKRLFIQSKVGPRNSPALSWLSESASRIDKESWEWTAAKSDTFERLRTVTSMVINVENSNE